MADDARGEKREDDKLKKQLAKLKDELGKRDVKIRETAFHFDKMLPREGLEAFEDLKPGLLDLIVKPMPDDVDAAIGIMLLSIPKETIEKARERLFPFITFGTNRNPGPFALFDEEDMAFEGLEMVHYYEVILRSFFVNFTDSFLELQSMSERLTGDSPRRNTSTSRPSSRPRSKQVSADTPT